MNFAKCLRTPFLQNTTGQLVLKLSPRLSYLVGQTRRQFATYWDECCYIYWLPEYYFDYEGVLLLSILRFVHRITNLYTKKIPLNQKWSPKAVLLKNPRPATLKMNPWLVFVCKICNVSEQLVTLYMEL